jgi:hypothetical protein
MRFVQLQPWIEQTDAKRRNHGSALPRFLQRARALPSSMAVDREFGKEVAAVVILNPMNQVYVHLAQIQLNQDKARVVKVEREGRHQGGL